MTTIEHIAIFANNTIALKDWYCKNFAMKAVYQSKEKMPAFFIKDAKGMCIEIMPRLKSAPPIKTEQVFHLAFKTDNFDQTIKELKAQGVFLEDEINPAPGLRVAFFSDPEGNRCQVVWRAKQIS